MPQKLTERTAAITADATWLMHIVDPLADDGNGISYKIERTNLFGQDLTDEDAVAFARVNVFGDESNEILITPTGWRIANRAAIKILSGGDQPSEIDLLHIVAGNPVGWQLSARNGATGDLQIYFNNNMNFTAVAAFQSAFRFGIGTAEPANIIDARSSRLNDSLRAQSLDGTRDPAYQFFWDNNATASARVHGIQYTSASSESSFVIRRNGTTAFRLDTEDRAFFRGTTVDPAPTAGIVYVEFLETTDTTIRPSMVIGKTKSAGSGGNNVGGIFFWADNQHSTALPASGLIFQANGSTGGQTRLKLVAPATPMTTFTSDGGGIAVYRNETMVNKNTSTASSVFSLQVGNIGGDSNRVTIDSPSATHTLRLGFVGDAVSIHNRITAGSFEFRIGTTGSTTDVALTIQSFTSTAVGRLNLANARIAVLSTTGSTNARLAFDDGTESGVIRYNHSADAMEFLVGATQRLRLDGLLAEFDSPIAMNAAGTAPPTPTSSGLRGQMGFDASFFYIATANNTWRRVGIASW